MAKRVTDEDILLINTVYYACKNKAETARQTGWSAGTVSRYLIPDFIPTEQEEISTEPVVLPQMDYKMFQVESWNDLLSLTGQEQKDILEFRKELLI